MSEEQILILQMVAEGKVSPTEAVSLLEAIEDKEPPHPTPPPRPRGGPPPWAEHFWKPFFGPNFSEDPFKADFDTAPQVLPLKPGTHLSIKTHTGPLTLVSTTEPNLKISGAPRGNYKISQSEEAVELKTGWMGSPLTIEIPARVTHLTVKSHVGEIMGQNLANTLDHVEIRSHTGQITIQTDELSQGHYEVQSHVGQLQFYLPTTSKCDIQAYYKMGNIETNLPLDIAEEGYGFLQGSLNGGGANISLSTKMGQILIGSQSPST